ncbi:MAG: hypothetical protein WCT10_00225 [Patescibacteria group bacterium]|jgi:hypothetical protein
MFRNKAHHEASNQAAFFLLFGLALSLVLLSGVLWLSVGSGMGANKILETGGSDLTRLLPPGWAAVAGSEVSFDDPVRPALVFAARHGQAGSLELAVWDRKAGDYRLAAQVDSRLTSQVELEVAELGQGAEQALLATAPLANLNAKGIFFAVRNGDRLEIARMKTGTGQVLPAFFIDGSIPNGDSRVAFYDVTGDGFDEVVVTRRSFGGAGPEASWGRSADVFEWSGGLFVYDQEMSWALTKSAEVFPEPADQE